MVKYRVDAETKINGLARDYHLECEHDEEALKQLLQCWLIEGFFSVTISKVYFPPYY
jgi:hypothetical protein